ncbi:hypothetical protein E1180_19405 [Roseibium denhamense]|uniref:Uncharacterized protein n=1 Tax=Roseibium denhamense TaxID=76305 RepID=A0ABY1P1V8_9HYPH|nr:hypothetical protein [Roseibium denhamense]MTI07673.1 hypothetical protein [Roseibium denhamense]SMP24409.1 hypothetical protein SAMN06265374_2441 [Roseibium denhamense]
MTNRTGKFSYGRMLNSVLISTFIAAGTAAAQAQTASVAEPAAAFSSARSAYVEAWESSGLAFAKALLTETKSNGFGQYSPRADADFAAGDPLYVYAEPVGYAFAQTGTGQSYQLTASYKLLNGSGQVLAEQQNFAEFSGSGRSLQLQLSAGLSFEFSGLPGGEYQLETMFTDTVGQQSASFTLPFTVTGTN